MVERVHPTGDRIAKAVLSPFSFGGERLSELQSVLLRLPDDGLHGRRKILTNKKEVTPENVVDIVNTGLGLHWQNRREIQYLWDCYRGKQDIRQKNRPVRNENNNKVMVNRANEIVTFKTAYLLGEPLQYVSNGGDDSVSEKVNRLNEFMRAEDKETKDQDIANWMHICGVGVRMVLPDPIGEEDGSPVSIYTLDPRESFVIYHGGIGQKPLAGVIRQKNEDGQWYSSVYTSSWYFEILGDKITTQEPHALRQIPIIEYLNNEARQGAFEIVLPVLNALNVIESNRIDNVVDFVNSYDVFQNCKIEEEQYKLLSHGGMAIEITSNVPGMESKVYRVSSELTQAGMQTIVDDLNQTYLTVCGMPNRNGGSSTSDTGQAVIFRDGFEAAESRAKDSEKTFKRSERDCVKLVVRICRDVADLDLQLSNIKMVFTRKNFANLQSKVQVLSEMLNNPKIHPKLAFEHCGLFSDTEEAYRMSIEWYEEQQKKLREKQPPDDGASEKPTNADTARESGQQVSQQ